MYCMKNVYIQRTNILLAREWIQHIEHLKLKVVSDHVKTRDKNLKVLEALKIIFNCKKNGSLRGVFNLIL